MKRESTKHMTEMTTSSIIRYLRCRLKEDANDLNNNNEFDSALSDAISSLNVLKSFY